MHFKVLEIRCPKRSSFWAPGAPDEAGREGGPFWTYDYLDSYFFVGLGCWGGVAQVDMEEPGEVLQMKVCRFFRRSGSLRLP